MILALSIITTVVILGNLSLFIAYLKESEKAMNAEYYEIEIARYKENIKSLEIECELLKKVNQSHMDALQARIKRAEDEWMRHANR